MLFSTDIPHLKVMRTRSFLPRDPKNPLKDNVCILCNINENRLSEYLNYKLAYHDMKYSYYFIDMMYTGKIGTKPYRLNKRSDVVTHYQKIEKEEKRITTVRNIDLAKQRNLYFSIMYENQLFFEKSTKLLYNKKIPLYLEYLSSRINDTRLGTYKNKFVMINIEEWIDATKNTKKDRYTFNDPVNILFFAMKKYFDEFIKLGNINIILFTKSAYMRLNPSLCDEKSFSIFRRELVKLNKTYTFLENDESVDENLKTEEMKQTIVNTFGLSKNFTGDLEDKIDNTIKKRVDEIVDEHGGEIKQEDLEKLVNTDSKLIKDIHNTIIDTKIGKSSASSKRDEELRQKQRELQLKDVTLKDLESIQSATVKLRETDISTKVKSTNKNVHTVKYPDFEKSYNDTLYKKDLSNSFMCLNDKSIPVFVKDIKVEDTSNELNLKETYTVTLEDGNRVRHTVKVDMPLFIDDKFMYLGGNRKLIVKQLAMKPIVKTGPNTVQICTNYNKMFLRRYGQKISPKIEKLNKLLSNDTNYNGIKFYRGNHQAENIKFKSSIEYDELSSLYDKIVLPGMKILFNQKEVKDELEKQKITLKDNELCIGFKGSTPIIMDLNTHAIDGDDIVDVILKHAPAKFVEDFNATTVGKKFIYTRAKLMKREVPLILLMCYYEGISTVLKKANIRHYFSDTHVRINTNDEGIIEFADGYLIYDKYPFENSLLMNAFADIPTKAFSYADLDGKEAYSDIFDTLYGTRNIGNYLTTFYEFMIDPITKEVLEDLGYPTDFVSVLIVANKLLVDNASTKEYKMDIYRVRSNEIVNVYLYNAIAEAYANYRQTANNKNPTKISVPQDVVLKKILTAQTVEDYSILNPIVELEKSRAITPKGPSGLNVDRAYTEEKRSYDKSMLGIIAVSTSPDGNCGVVRQLTLEPNIIGPRGYIDVKENNLDELKDVNLFSPAELLSPLGVTRDDTIRTAMSSKQSKHIVPIEKSSPVLISNGVEQAVQYHLSNDFIVRAKEDGKVIQVDEETGLVIVQYKSGEKQAIDTSPKIVKNGAGGFYLSNQLSCDLKVGQTVKQNDIIASDKNFFHNDKLNGNRFNIGSLQKVACMSTYSTYEDSSFITKKLSEDMTAKIVMQKPVVLGKNANVDHIVNVGDEVQVGDELMRFELSFEQDNLNNFLASIGEDLQEEIKSLGKTPIKSKYTGTVIDIKMYSTVDLEELSPSLRRLMTKYYERIKKKHKVIDSHDKSKAIYKMGILLNEATGKIETKDGKIKGNEVGDGVLIEFYIQYRDKLGVGDKITYFTALKSVIGEQIEEGYEPYTEFRPDEEISSAIAPGAILARMTPSILLTMFGNKVLVELKRTLYKQYTGKEWQCNEIE